MRLTVRHETDAAAIAAALDLVAVLYLADAGLPRAQRAIGRQRGQWGGRGVIVLIDERQCRSSAFHNVSEFLAAVPTPAVYIWAMFAFLKYSRDKRAREAVVVGMSGTSAVGIAEEYPQGVLEQRNGVAGIARFPAQQEGYIEAVAAQVPNWEYRRSEWLSPIEIKMLSLQAQFVIVAARNAIKDSGLRRMTLDRIAILLGSGMPAMEVLEDHITSREPNFYAKAPEQIKQTDVGKFYIGSPAHTIARDLGAIGPVETLGNACTSVMSSTIHGSHWIESGACDIAVVGGCEAPVNRTTISSMSAGKMHANSSAPEQVMKPFSKGRTTSVLGEGAGVLVLASREFAEKQSLRIYGRLRGYAHMQENTRTPDKSGKNWSIAMMRALNGVGVPDAVNSHGPSHKSIDLAEANGLRLALGDEAASAVPVFSIKPCIGSGMGAAGALQSIMSLYCLYHDVVPPTRNYEGDDPEIKLNVTTGRPKNMPLRTMLQNSRDIGGGVVSMCWESEGKRYESA